MSNSYMDLPLTSFPENMDSFLTFLDITASDGPIIQRYMEAIHSGNQILANQILTQIPQATQKIIKAADLNKLSQAIQAVERFYKSDVFNHIVDNETKWRNEVLRFKYIGPWDNNATYQQYNMVSYVVKDVNTLFIALQDVTTGIAPTNTAYWRVLTVQGIQGVPGEGLSFSGKWDQYVNYTVNTSVIYGGGLWMAVNPSVGSVPSEGSADWKLIMVLETTTYPIQPTPPVVMETGALWFNTSKTPTQYYYLLRLDNPAGPGDIRKGKEVYDSKGQKVVGTGNF